MSRRSSIKKEGQIIMENKNRIASESIGFKVYNKNDDKMQIYNLIVKGQEIPGSSVVCDLPIQCHCDTPTSITLIKNQSIQCICDIDDSCTMWAQVDFDLRISEPLTVYLKYNIGNKGDVSLGCMSQKASDTLEILNEAGYAIVKKEVDWHVHF